MQDPSFSAKTTPGAFCRIAKDIIRSRREDKIGMGGTVDSERKNARVLEYAVVIANTGATGRRLDCITVVIVVKVDVANVAKANRP